MAAQLRETLLDGKGMPGWFFTSNEFLQAEKQYFFRNSWVCIGLEIDVNEPGDVYPVTILAQPLLVLRGRVPDLGQRPIVNANWKLVVENFVESYHLPWVHASMNAFNPMGAHYQILGGRHFIGQGVKAHNPDDIYAGRFKHFPGLNEDELGTGESMYVPANLLLITMSDFMFANILIPESPDRTAERIEMFLIGEGATNPGLQHERQKLMDMLARVNNEDIGICELAQKGRNSEAFTGGVFASAQEQSTLQFQQLVALKMLLANGEAGESLPELPVDDIHHPIPRSVKPQD